MAVGQEILDRELRRRRHAKLTDAELQRGAQALALTDLDHVHASIGQGDITVTQLLKAIYPELDEASNT